MEMKQLPDDFKDFIQLLNENEVKYLLVGGWAIGIYGNPRATKDIDFFIGIDDENINRLQQAMYEFGIPAFDQNLLKEPGNVFRIGRSPIQIDLINSASGITFEESYASRNTITVSGVKISLISKNDLLKNKLASGRHQDLADAENLKMDQD